MTIVCLPVEILGLIALHLSYQDCLTCMCVCREWYAIFCESLYRCICFDVGTSNFDTTCMRIVTEQILPFMLALQRAEITSVKLGRFVQKIIVNDAVLSADNAMTLGALCSHLTTLHYKWQDIPNWGTRGPTNSLILPDNTSMHKKPIKFLEAIGGSRLTHLTLQYQLPLALLNGLEQLQVANILQYTPQLESLALFDLLPDISIACLDMIHRKCPRLLRLEVKGDALIVPYTDVPLSPHEPTNTTYLRVMCCSGWTHYAVLMEYIAHKYPKLECLTLECTRETSSLGRNNATITQQREAACALLARKCPHLTQIRLVNIGLQRHVYPALLSTLNVSHLTVHQLPAQELTVFKELIQSVSESATLLDLTLPRQSASLQWDILTRFRHLWTLTIRNRRPWINESQVHIDNLLHHCRHLKHLELERLHLRTNVIIIDQHTPSMSCQLKRLCLTEVIISPDALDYVSHHCHDLVTLKLISCSWSGVYWPNSKRIIINMSHQDLWSIQIYEPRVPQPLVVNRPQRNGIVKVFAYKETKCQSETMTDQGHTQDTRDQLRWIFVPSKMHIIDNDSHRFNLVSKEWFELDSKRIEYALNSIDNLLPSGTPSTLPKLPAKRQRSNSGDMAQSAHPYSSTEGMHEAALQSLANGYVVIHCRSVRHLSVNNLPIDLEPRLSMCAPVAASTL